MTAAGSRLRPKFFQSFGHRTYGAVQVPLQVNETPLA